MLEQPPSESAEDPRVRSLAREYANLDAVVAVALGGSRATGRGDLGSDVDLYVYGQEILDVESRRAIAERRGSPAEIDNTFWEVGDEWIERADGLHVDVMFRTVAWAEAQVDRVLGQHRADLGYTTATLFNLATCRILADRSGWLGRLQQRAAVPLPDAAAQAIIDRNLPLLRGALGAYPNQLAKAWRRQDWVAVNHRLAALMASYFDVLFALNRRLHPGEKRLAALAAELPVAPTDLRQRIEALLSCSSGCPDLPATVEALVDDLLTLVEGDRPA